MHIKKISWFWRLFWTWEKLKNYFLSNNDDIKIIATLENDKEYLKSSNTHLMKDKERLNQENDRLRQEVYKYQIKYEEREKNLNENKQTTIKLEKELILAKEKITAKQQEQEKLKFDILDRLKPLQKIETTFFAKSISKGKGELGEMQIVTVLEKSGLPNDFWTENLMVGKNKVEFAIKSGQKGKWIPIDSKVIETDANENNEIIIDNKYKTRVKSQVKEITKYLSKNNTTHYGVLVLQSDAIYMNLYDKYPNLFQNALRDQKVYIASPSSFVQMAWSINEIIEIYDRVKSDYDIYENVLSILNSIANFANNLKDIEKNFNSAMNSHFPAIENKHIKLKEKLDKTDKTKSIKSIKIKK